MTYPTLLPPASTTLEKALEQVAFGLTDLPTPVRDIWSPDTCPIGLLPWLAWGLSIDLWDSTWSETEKRTAVANAIAFQRHKGTPASLRTVLDRIDPLIEVVEWFDDRGTLDPYHFRLELPLLAQSDVLYDEVLVAQILRDIAQVKPVRSHMQAVFRVKMAAEAWLLSGARTGGLTRLEPTVDTATALEPEWDTYLQTADGEPFLDGAGAFLEV
ncbi:phage tail protein I [Sphingobium yanoikuyae]|uniref:Phage tail protein I n=1 Tax=Sphingobium yanoikuyae TaxID=13690 RepID=A0A291N2R6_SPHYA|nr:phage tail protein I [Sphingobium yanoikuyae]ATI81460.1 phage tail protein I [Sphingobium yanoikuyae]